MQSGAKMYSVIESLKEIKWKDPEKYQRIVDRLSNSTKSPEGKKSKAWRKSPVEANGRNQSLFATLQLIDDKNRHFWGRTGTIWDKTDVSEAEIKSPSSFAAKKDDFVLIKTLLTSKNPVESFDKMLLHNPPHKLLKVLLQKRRPKEVLYMIRKKFKLSLPPFLRLKAEENLNSHKTLEANREALRNLEASLDEIPDSETEISRDSSDSGDFVTDTHHSNENVVEETVSDPSADPSKETRPIRHSIVETVLSPEDASLSPEKDGQNQSVSGDSDDHAVKSAKDRLEHLRVIFEESDLDDEPGLDIDEFKLAMRRIHGESLTEREIALIFMKVDANCDGNVDWNEFLQYTLREYQERDLMSQTAREVYFDKGPEIKYRGMQEMRSIVWCPLSAAYSPQVLDYNVGRYYTVTTEGVVRCWNVDLTPVGEEYYLVPNFKSVSCRERVADMVCMPEIRAIAVGFTTGLLKFYSYEEAKLDRFCTVYGIPTPPVVLHYAYQEGMSLLFFADYLGKIQAIRFANLFYDGFWTAIGVSQRANNIVSWADLRKAEKCVEIPCLDSRIHQVLQLAYHPQINTIMACSNAAKQSLILISIQEQREPLYISNSPGGFNCFDYNHAAHLIATGGTDHCLKIWIPDRLSGPLYTFTSHAGSVEKVLLTHDADFTAAVTIDSFRTIRMFNIKEQLLWHEFEYPLPGVRHGYLFVLTYNPTRRYFVYGANEILYLERKGKKKEKTEQGELVKSHNDPIVATLYNDLFDCAVSGCQGSTIMVWNFQNGEKIIHFQNAHSKEMGNGKVVAVPIRDTTFDASKRRLLTVGEDGLMKIWNFNNGACLSVLAQLAGKDISTARYHRNRDLVIAAGFYKNIFMVRDTRGEDDLDPTEYRWLRLHRSDVVSAEVFYPEDQAPAGSATLAPKPSILTAALTRSGIYSHHSHQVSPIKSAFSVAESSGSSSSEDSKLADDESLLVTASFDGEIIVWDIFNGEPICFLNTDGIPEALNFLQRTQRVSPSTQGVIPAPRNSSWSLSDFFSASHRRHGEPHGSERKNVRDEVDAQFLTTNIPKLAMGTTDSVSCMLLLEGRDQNDPRSATIVTALTDGFVKAWSACLGSGGLRAVFYGGKNLRSFVTGMCTDAENEILFTADNTGYVAAYFICDWANKPLPASHRHGFDPRPFPAIRRHRLFAPIFAYRTSTLKNLTIPNLDYRHRKFYETPVMLNSFRAHLSAITHITVVSIRHLIVTSSRDCSIRLWTFAGLYVGTLGQVEPLHVDISKDQPPVPRYDFGRKVRETEAFDEIFAEKDTADEILLRPRTVLPSDIAAAASLVTLEVVNNLKHRTWQSMVGKTAKAEVTETQPQPKLHSAAPVQSDFPELQIAKKKNSEKDRTPFAWFQTPVDTMHNEISLYRNISEKPMENLSNLHRLLPDCAFDYSVRKVQDDLIQKLPHWLQSDFLRLQKEGKLFGEAMRKLVKLAENSQIDENEGSAETPVDNARTSPHFDHGYVRKTLAKFGHKAARQTLVDFLLEPEKKHLAHHFIEAGKSLSLVSLENDRQTRTSIPVVAGDMDMLTDLRTVERFATQKKRPRKMPSLVLIPSKKAADEIQNIICVDDMDPESAEYRKLFRITETIAPRKLPRVPRLKKKTSQRKAGRKLFVKVSRRKTGKSSPPGQSLIEFAVSVDDFMESPTDHGKSVKVASAEEERAQNPVIVPVSPYRVRRGFRRYVAKGRLKCTDSKIALSEHYRKVESILVAKRELVTGPSNEKTFEVDELLLSSIELLDAED